MTDRPATYHRGKRDYGTGYDMMERIDRLEGVLTKSRGTGVQAMTDMDALMAAADALADEADRIAAIVNDDHGHRPVILSKRITAYRAAREAVRKGTPPAFATSA